MSQREAFEQEAAIWIARQDGQDWKAQDSVDFENWIGQSTAHRVAYLRLRAGWEKLDGLATRPPLETVQPRRKAIWAAVFAAAAAVLLVVGIPLMRSPEPSTLTYATKVGGRSTVSLDDGSSIELNTNSRVRAIVNDRERTAWLDQGEAFFSIAPDKARPFVVYSGNRRISVIGTRFSVRKDNARLSVAVLEGRVRVGAADGSGAATLLTAGDTAIVQQASIFVQTEAPQRVEEAMAWRNDQLRFNDVPLKEAVDEFNRYNHRQIRISDEDTAALRIGGSFRATDIDAFTRLLENVFGLQVVNSGDTIEISGGKAAPREDVEDM